MLIKLWLAITIFFGSLSGGVALAADRAVPGDMLYNLDRSIESLRLDLASSSEQVTRLQEQFTQERLDEIQVLYNRDDQPDLAQAWTDLSVTATAAPNTLEGSVDEVLAAQDPADTADRGTYCSEGTLKVHPVGQKLADDFVVTYEEIMSWFCQGFGFGEINLAYELSRQFAMEPAELFDMKTLGMGWGEIMKSLGLPGEGEEQVVDVAATDEPKPPSEFCTGADPHPHAMDLADQFGVTYETIMGWFCQGYGFGEVKLAYEMSVAVSVTVTDTFNLRASGLGWGQIKQQYGLIGKPQATEEPQPPEIQPPEALQPPNVSQGPGKSDQAPGHSVDNPNTIDKSMTKDGGPKKDK